MWFNVYHYRANQALQNTVTPTLFQEIIHEIISVFASFSWMLLFGTPYICRGHLGLSRNQLGKKTWSEDILRGKRKKEKKWRRNVDEFNMRWRKKDFCQITWQWGTVSPCWGHAWKQTGGLRDSPASLFSFSQTNVMKMQTVHQSHGGLWHAHSYMCNSKTRPSPVIPRTYPDTHFHSTRRSYKASHLTLSYYHEDGPFKSTIHLN